MCLRKSFPIVLSLMFIVLGVDRTVAAKTIFVDDDASGANNGSSWDDAFAELQSALAGAVSGDEIWVAAGTYKPDYNVHTGVHNGDRKTPFLLIDGVAAYGGLVGDEEPATFNLDHRDFESNETILSGDLNSNDVAAEFPDGPSFSDNSYRVVLAIKAGHKTILDGFTITAGNANHSSYWTGGGIRIDGGHPTVANCTFSGNSATDGGGMYCVKSNPALNKCTFVGNSATSGTGGGINCLDSTPVIADCLIVGNVARMLGGGISCNQSSPTVTGCTISENRSNLVLGGGMGISGGGMANSFGSDPTLTDCTFSGNSAYTGGGMYNYESNPTLTDCTFSENSADTYGGGMRNQSSHSLTLINCIFSENSAVGGGGMDNHDSSPTMTNCAFIGNSVSHRGGGIYNYGGYQILTNCTFSGNSADQTGGAIYGKGSYSSGGCKMTLTNCILWGDSAVEGPEMTVMPSSSNDPSIASVSFSDVQGGPGAIHVDPSCTLNWSAGNINADPSFVDPDGPDDDPDTWEDNDLQLSPGSLCSNVGDNSAIPIGITTDLAGNPRIFNSIVDMGAYECQVILANLDIKPGGCPNPLNVNTKNKGRLSMAILGTDDFDVSQIDVNSISINETILPVRVPKIEDVSTPADGDGCQCQTGDGDGINDLVIHFMRRELILALGLDTLQPGTVVPVTVKGKLLDGESFTATDCVKLVGRRD